MVQGTSLMSGKNAMRGGMVTSFCYLGSVPEPQGTKELAERCRRLLYNVRCNIWVDEFRGSLLPGWGGMQDKEGKDEVC